MNTFNVNADITIHLTEFGKMILKEKYPWQFTKIKNNNEFTEQMWTIMSIFGPYLANEFNTPFETEIELSNI
jgi:hypothetical protein